VGFFLSTVLLYHGTFAINSLAHVVGRRRYVTGDESRNNWWLALITLGEGWHNNHHHYQSSTRQGFFWWEIDPSYYLLKVLETLGLVWDLRAPPEEVVRGENRLGRRVVEREARQVAEMFSLEGMLSELERVWDQLPGFADAVEKLKGARPAAVAQLQKKREEITAQFEALHLPDFPSMDEIRARLAKRYRDTPGLDDVAERVQEILLEKILIRLAPRLNAGPA
jgi:stearoyl-CoA desaturase (delta-9 desaturase)